jgi:ribosome-associated toxin RatA of RatAB toxin-antitoxin module
MFGGAMDTSEYRHQELIEISRSPEDLYNLVADVSRMGQWSPVCTGGSYDEDGEWFTGTNAMGESNWETRCRVVVANPGHEFAFINHGLEGRVEMVRWGFRFDPLEGNRTEVTQTWEVLPDYADGLGLDEASAVSVLEMMKTAALKGMPETLAALKADAETAT